MKTKNLTITACIVASFGTTILFADEPKPEGRREANPERKPEAGLDRKPEARGERRPEGGGERRPEAGPGRGFPGADALTQEEREKLRAAMEKVGRNEKVQAAELAVRDAMKALADARDGAVLAVDPALEPIVSKLKEAREKRAAGMRRGGEGEAPRRGEGDRPRTREGEQPKRGEGDRPKVRDGEQPRRGEGDQPSK